MTYASTRNILSYHVYNKYAREFLRILYFTGITERRRRKRDWKGRRVHLKLHVRFTETLVNEFISLLFLLLFSNCVTLRDVYVRTWKPIIEAFTEYYRTYKTLWNFVRFWGNRNKYSRIETLNKVNRRHFIHVKLATKMKRYYWNLGQDIPIHPLTNTPHFGPHFTQV